MNNATCDIVLVRPNANPKQIVFFAFRFPNNIALLKSYLNKYGGYNVEIWDYEDTPEEVVHFKERVARTRPRFIGFSCITPTIKRGAELAQQAKEVSPDIVTIVGGPHSTAIPEETLKEFPFFDVVVVGEGEETLLQLCRRIDAKQALSGLEGIVHRQGEKICKEKPRALIQNLDSIPYPDRSSFNLYKKRRSHFGRGIADDFLKGVDIFSSRGCPSLCTFCAGNLTHSQGSTRYRVFSPEYTLGEIEECIKLGFTHIGFMDDTFTIDRKRVFKICEGIRKLKLKSWDCQARVNTVDKEMLVELVKSGCWKISFGVESGSQKILDLIKKGIKLEQVRKAFTAAREAGFRLVEGTFLVGCHPEETPEDVAATAALVKELPSNYVCVSVLVPYPGTAIYNEMKEKGYILSYDWDKYFLFGDKPQWCTKHFSSSELIKQQNKVLKSFYLNPRNLLRLLTHLRNFGELKYLVRAGLNFIQLVVFGKNT